MVSPRSPPLKGALDLRGLLELAWVDRYCRGYCSTRRRSDAAGLRGNMLQIMLCGAHDVDEISTAFTDVVEGLGADPWLYQRGKIHHINSRTSRWAENSRATVNKVDICVFVMADRYGDITWSHELQEALQLGKPFVVLALESAWVRYNNLHQSLSDPSALRSEDDRQMVELLRMISSDYQITVTPFTFTAFKEILRGELAGLFQAGVELLQMRNQRAMLLDALTGSEPMSRSQVDQLLALATDEYEANKLARKSALRRLAADGVRDNELLLEVCRSTEQGVQRLGFDLLPDLLVLPPNEDVVRELAQIASGTDDVGVPRRLVSALGKIEPGMTDVLFDGIGSAEEGLRRRAYEVVEGDWDSVLSAWGRERMHRFLDACEVKTPTRARWVDRLRGRRDDLG